VAASALLGILLALVATEGGIRVLWWVRARAVLSEMARTEDVVKIDSESGSLAAGFQKSPFPEIVYELRPNARGVYDGKRYATDRFGFREDRRLELDKANGVRRIVGIGDSWMWGSGVDNGETYLDVLDGMLKARAQPLEVINTGVVGYNAVQQVGALARKGLRFSPDIVVVGLCRNDREYPAFLDASSYIAIPGSALGLVLSRALERIGIVGTRPVPEAYSLMPFSEFMRAYDELASMARRHGFRVVVFSECVHERTHEPCNLGTREEWKTFIDAARGRWQFLLCGWDPREVDQNEGPWGHASPQGNVVLPDRLVSCLEPLLK
jgi:hypothetical protein